MNLLSWFRDHLNPILLAVIILSGACLRLSNLDWDSGYQLHPDERGILLVAKEVRLPHPPIQLLSAGTSPANPFRNPDGSERPFAYGHLPLYATVLTANVINAGCTVALIALPLLCNPNPQQSVRDMQLLYAGRMLSALADTATILVTYSLAAKLFGRWAGLISASMVAFAVFHIQNAHFGTYDTWLTLLSVCCINQCMNVAAYHRTRDTILSGIFAGLAVGCKATGVLVIPLVLGVHILRQPSDPNRSDIKRLIRSTLMSLAFVLLAFGLSNPYALLDPVRFGEEIGRQATILTGSGKPFFALQYADVTPVLYTFHQQIRWTLGIPLTLILYSGLGWACLKSIRGTETGMRILSMWTLSAWVILSSSTLQFPRYLLPTIPPLAVLAAGLLSELFSQPSVLVRRMAGISYIVVVVSSILFAISFVRMYESGHPWIAASQWLYSTVLGGTVIAVEDSEDALPMDDIEVNGRRFIREQALETVILGVRTQPNNTEVLLGFARVLHQADYLVISTSRFYGVLPRFEDQYPASTTLYRMLFSNELGYEMIGTYGRSPNLFGCDLIDDPFTIARLESPLKARAGCHLAGGFADESLTLYDHPLVMVFKNVRRYGPQEFFRSMLRQYEEARQTH